MKYRPNVKFIPALIVGTMIFFIGSAIKFVFYRDTEQEQEESFIENETTDEGLYHFTSNKSR